MKTLLITLFTIVSLSSISAQSSDCLLSEARVRNYIKSEWSNIQSKASFTISDRKNFEIRHYGLDGNDLTARIFSKGYMYDISFTVSFDARFDSDCEIEGKVIDVFDRKKH